MLCLENSFLIDWFRGQAYTRRFLETRDADEAVIVPTPVLHELVRGALRTESYPSRPADIYAVLDYAQFQLLTVGQRKGQPRFALRWPIEGADRRVRYADRWNGGKCGCNTRHDRRPLYEGE